MKREIGELAAWDTENLPDGRVDTIAVVYEGGHRILQSPSAARTFIADYQGQLKDYWCFNLEYDALNLFRDVYDEIIPTFTASGKLLKVRWNKAKVNFFDLSNWFEGYSLAQLGDLIGMKKLTMPRRGEKARQEYCLQDAKIVFESIRKLHKDFSGTIPSTVSAAAWKLVRKLNDAPSLFFNLPSWVMDFLRLAYYGGRQEMFFKGCIEGKHYLLDINSAYGYSMLFNFPNPELWYPVGEMETITPLGVYQANINTQQAGIGLLPIKIGQDTEERLVFPLGEFSGTWCGIELINARNFGYDVEIKKGIEFYKQGKYLAPFVNTLFAHRERSAFDSAINKRLINSLTGKFAQKAYTEKIISESDFFSRRLNEKTDTYKVINGTVYFKGGKLAPWVNVVWSVTINARARMLLLSYMLRAGLKNVLHVSTDALLVNQEGYDNLKEYIDETKIGYLKIAEKGIVNVDVRGVNDLEIDSVRKIKGIPTRAKQKGKNTYEYLKPPTLREVITRGAQPGVWKKKKIVLTREYTKGKVNEDGSVDPLTLKQKGL